MVQLASSLIPKAVSLPGAMTKDPRLLPLIDAATVCSNGNSYNPTQPGFWTGATAGMEGNGALRTTATAGQFGTVVNITGRGVLTHVIPPLHGSTSSVVAFRITVDGQPYTITKNGGLFSGAPTQGRVFLGCADLSGDTAFYTSANYHLFGFGQQLAGAAKYSVYQAYLYQPWRVISHGMPCVFFEESLKVETMVSDLGAGAYAQYSGCVYKMLGGD